MRVELGDPGHEKLAASVDGRRPCRRRPLSAHIRDASVLDDHRLIGEDGLAIHRDHRDAREDDGCLLRLGEGGYTHREENETGGERTTKHLSLHEGRNDESTIGETLRSLWAET